MQVLSVVIPVYQNEESLPELVSALVHLADRARREHAVELEAVFVVDGSPDRSHQVLAALLPVVALRSRLLAHSRNFGSFAAIRSGLAAGSGDVFAVMAADLQEPPELVLDFLTALRRTGSDVAVGRRTHREDGAAGRWAAGLFWRLYRRAVNPEIPVGGVDVFACTKVIRDQLLRLREANSSLVALIFWLGYDRVEVEYARGPRPYGRSAWTVRRRVRYLLDSVFSFTALPITILTAAGALGVLVATVLAAVTLVARVVGDVPVPGYAALILAVTFFGALNLLGLGVIGAYARRAFENTKGRPPALVRSTTAFAGTAATSAPAPGAGARRIDLDALAPAGGQPRPLLAREQD